MKVLDITPENEDDYDANLLNSGDYECFLKIHTPSCGFCKQLQPEWEKLEEFAKSNGNDSVYIISLDANSKDKFNVQSEVHGYPTIIYLNKDGSVKNEYKSSDRSFDKLKEFLFAQNPPMMIGGKRRKSRKHQNIMTGPSLFLDDALIMMTGGKRRKSKKHRSRKHRSKKHRSKKHRSKKHLSRKH